MQTQVCTSSAEEVKVEIVAVVTTPSKGYGRQDKKVKAISSSAIQLKKTQTQHQTPRKKPHSEISRKDLTACILLPQSACIVSHFKVGSKTLKTFSQGLDRKTFSKYPSCFQILKSLKTIKHALREWIFWLHRLLSSFSGDSKDYLFLQNNPTSFKEFSSKNYVWTWPAVKHLEIIPSVLVKV